MLIVDTQVHVWKAQPSGHAAAHHSRASFTMDDLLAEMAGAGVDRAVIVPASNTPSDHCYEAVRMHPERFGIMDGVSFERAKGEAELKKLRDTQGFLGLRLAFHTPERKAALADGSVDWIWAEAEKQRLPVAVWAAGSLAQFAKIAERHPDLRLIIDHFGVDSSLKQKDGGAFTHIDQLTALAKYPNVAAKASGIAGYSSEPYPFPKLAPYIEKIVRAFGSDRIFWGTDLTRMPCTYRQCVTHYTETMSFLSEEDKRLIMGEGFCRWVGWEA